MTTISKLTDGGPAVVFAQVHITSETRTSVEFEVLESNAASLRSELGVKHLLSYNDRVPIWAELVSLEPCVSTAVGLGRMRERPTLRGKLILFAEDTPALQ
jgi:hypothetical protein